MIAEAAFFGRAKDQTTGATVTLNFNLYRVHTVSTTSAGINIKLQSARQLQKGGPIGFVVNAGANSLNLVDNSSNLLAVMAAGDAVSLALLDNTTAAGSWIVLPGTANFVADPPANLYFYVCGGAPAGTFDHTQREYNSQIDAWTQRSDMPSPVTQITEGASAVHGTAGYFFGVTGSAGSDRQRIFHYDPDVWTEKTANGATFMAECLGVTLGGSIVTFNGTAFDSKNTDEYVVSGDSWTARTDRPTGTAVTNPTGALANSKAVITDGISNACESYTVNAWVTETSRPGADARRCSATSKANVCYTYGGSAGNFFIANVYAYTESAGTWASMASLSPARESASTCSIGTSNYLAGGKKGTAGTSSTSSSTATKETVEHQVSVDTYVTRSDMVATTSDQVYNAMNQGAAITP